MITFDNNLFVGKVLITLEEVPSTNDFAKDLLSKSKPLEGTAIIAHTQTKGKGQIGNTWYSQPGKNVTLSVILYPSFLKASEQFVLTQAIALAVCETVATTLKKQVQIKWPNDIFCDGKKISGILVENTVSGQYLSDSVVGIGLNVNQLDFNGLPWATSIALSGGAEHEIDTIRNVLFSLLEKRYLQLKNSKLATLKKEYETLLFRRDEWHTYQLPTGSISGRITGVNAYGQLQVETEAGMQSFNNKEIEFVL